MNRILWRNTRSRTLYRACSFQVNAYCLKQQVVSESDGGMPYGRSQPMPRQRVHHTRVARDFPEDFPRRLELFKEASGLSWAELARRLGTYPDTIRGWCSRVRPNARHLMALLNVADAFGLRHPFTEPGAVCGNGLVAS